ncbi:glycosyltransferase family 4 protein [Pontibacter burrus]|uniref:Glycosyltransferase family 4 protein n=1 Tax=Pontibacter burrus TaxID=2704466 RepID=A0A6B3LQ42_9BACT|nr:glycosyltransferase family 4 protein [Pontibacter burrus]NEM98889.1 glycosyltransferase family 4 protein [Pontibacter burrus]
MRIALLTDGIYPYVLGGMQKHSYYLAKYLAQQKVEVLLYHTGPAEANTTELSGFTKDELSFIHSVYIPFPSVGKYPGHYVLESYLYAATIYRDLLRQNDVHFIYAQGFTGWKLVHAKKNGSKLPPIGINFHGVEMFQKAPNLNVRLQHLLLRTPVKYNLRHADIVFSLGGKLTALQEAITLKPVLEIPIGIERNWIGEFARENRQTRKFIFIGRYERRKGIEELQQVLKELDTNYSFEFIFIGPIPEEKQLRKDNIKYLGLIKEEQEVKHVLRDVDVLVCPSYSEGMPTVILEAMASGLAIVATDVGAVRTMVSEENGWLIPPANKKALRQAIVEAIELGAQSLHKKKEASLQLVIKSFTWDTVIKKTIDVMSNLVTF